MSAIGVALGRVELTLGGRRVLGPLDLDLAPGSHALLLGANGAGKTQLLKILAGERWPTPTGRERRTYRDRRGRRLELAELLPRIALVSGERQDKYVRRDWNFSVERLVGTGCRATDRPLARLTAVEGRRVARLLKRLGLWALRRRRFLTLSYGERRRVLLARALAMRPRLLLLDEPFNGLDALSRRMLERELARLAGTGLSMVLSAHRPEDAPRAFRRVLRLQGGRLVHDGVPRAAARQRLLGGAGTAPRAAARARRRVTAPGRAGSLVVLREVTLYRDYRPVLTALNWTIAAGESWGILGANGSGKSTLLRFLYGDLHAALGGAIERRDHPPATHIEAWRRRVGWVSPELEADYLAEVSIGELIASGLSASVGLECPAGREARRRARRALERVGLEVDPRRGARELSYGQRRLAFFARALILEPEALLLDEPLTGLDAGLRACVRALLSRLAQDGVQLVMATHHERDLVPEIRQVLALEGGRAHARPARPART